MQFAIKAISLAISEHVVSFYYMKQSPFLKHI